MRVPTAKESAWFVLLPVQRRDFAAFGEQWRVAVRAIAGAYQKLGLITDDVDDVTARGMHGVLMSAASGWWWRWAPKLNKGWHAGAGEGLSGRLGGSALAVWSGRHEIVRDGAAVSIGIIAWGAMWFWLFWAMTKGMVGVAHAQTITGGGGSSDIARQLLGNMFSFLGGGAGSVLAQGLGLIAQTLSKIAFTLGGASMVWGMFVMVVDYTVDEDGFKQRHSWHMFFVRCAIVVPMLTPLSGGWDGGQRLAVAAGAYGSDMATTAWTSMVSYLSDSKNWVAAPFVSEVDLAATVANTVAAEACMAAVNSDPAKQGTEAVSYSDSTGRYDYLLTDPLLQMTLTESAGGCGTVVFPNPTAQGAQASSGTSVSAFLSAHKTAFAAMQGNVRKTIATMVAARIKCRDTPTSCPPDTDPSVAAGWVNDYRTAIQSGVSGAMASVNQKASQALATNATVNGWIGAAAWANSLSQLQGSIDGAAGAIPQVSGPKIGGVNDFVNSTMKWYGNGQASGASPSPMVQAQAAIQSGSSSALDKLFQAITPNTVQLFPQIQSMSPLAGISTLGRWVYGIALAMKTGSALLSVAKIGTTVAEVATALPSGGTSLIVGETTKAAIDAFQNIISAIWVPIALLGMAIAYFVPSLPFIRMLFGVMGWLIAFAETVFLVPVMLVLMVSTESGGVFVSAAKSCLWNIAALVVRPILTVAGFVIGIIVISGMVAVLNMIMVPMIVNNEGGNFVFFGFFAYVVIYLGIAYVIVNAATKTAELLPMAAYKWMGANAGGERDDASHVSVALGAALGKFERAARSPKAAGMFGKK